MANWHKAGQKVACIKGGGWIKMDRQPAAGPATDDVCIIERVHYRPWPVLALVEWPEEPFGAYWASYFRPVFPSRIDALRGLDVKQPAKGTLVRAEA